MTAPKAISEAQLVRELLKLQTPVDSGVVTNRANLLDNAIQRLRKEERTRLSAAKAAAARGDLKAAELAQRAASDAAQAQIAYTKIRNLAMTVWRGLQDPRLIVKVVRDIKKEAQRIRSSGEKPPNDISVETQAVMNLSERASGKKSFIVREVPGDRDFFHNHATRDQRFLDLGIAKEDATHGAATHAFQDLVVDEAFKRAGVRMRAEEFRALLGRGDRYSQKIFPSRPAGPTGPIDSLSEVGQRLWDGIFHDSAIGLHDPNKLFPILKQAIPGLQ